MDVAEVKNHIKTKQFKPLYIFTGVEWKVQKIYIDMISKVSGRELRYIDSVTDIFGNLKNRSFSQRSYVYVTRDDKEFIQEEQLQDKLPSVLGDNTLIILLTSVDKRLKFYKRYKDTICEFEPLNPVILRKYIQKEINLSDTNCNRLMEVCENDYGRCLLEIDKIKHWVVGYGKDKQEQMPEDGGLLRLLNDGTIYQPPKDAIFDFVDAVLDNKFGDAFYLYHQCLDVGEAVMVMLTVLYNNAKATLQVQSCTSGDIAKSTGLTGFQIMNAKKHCNKRRNGDLIYIMDLCRECQQGIVTGKIEEEFVMDYILTNIM